MDSYNRMRARRTGPSTGLIIAGIVGAVAVAAVAVVAVTGTGAIEDAVSGDPNREAVRLHILKWASRPESVEFIEWGPVERKPDGDYWVGVSWRDTGGVHQNLMVVSQGRVYALNGASVIAYSSPYNQLDWRLIPSYNGNPSAEESFDGLVKQSPYYRPRTRKPTSEK